MKGHTKYSAVVPGDRGNYGNSVRFDMTDGYLGITEMNSDKPTCERVLLSPKQVKALRQWIGSERKRCSHE